MTLEEIRDLSSDDLLALGSFDCECGKRHKSGDLNVIIEHGAIKRLPSLLKELGCSKPFIVSGHDTFAAAGEKVCDVLRKANIAYGNYIFPISPVLPTEHTVGSVLLNYDFSCDCIIAVGSGVINDTSKFLAAATKNEFIVVGTAPSMDGYASATSSMDRDNLKVSISTCFAHTIIGDLDILCQAPIHMLQAGVGDMLAKYVSIVEWNIAGIITGEYYCPVIAAIVSKALQKVVDAAPGVINRDEEAVKAIMEGLVVAGLAMSYAGVSRPASGMEHYFSHIWDMRSLAFPELGHDLHGIQVGIGTLLSLKVWEYIRGIKPNRAKALSYVSSFSVDKWNERLISFIGPGAQTMIAGENREHKYDKAKHCARLERILDSWDEIVSIAETLPKYEDVLSLMTEIGEPVSADYIGYSSADVAESFMMTKDIRDKYVASRLLWDLGELDEAADKLFLRK